MSKTQKWVDVREAYLDTPGKRAGYAAAGKKLAEDLARWQPRVIFIEHDPDACPYCSNNTVIRAAYEASLVTPDPTGWQCGICGLATTDLGTMHEMLHWKQDGPHPHFDMVCPSCESVGEFVDYTVVPDIDQLRDAYRLIRNQALLEENLVERMRIIHANQDPVQSVKDAYKGSSSVSGWSGHD